MKNIQTILAVIDDSKLNSEVLKKSIELASNFNAKIIVLHTIHIPFLDLKLYSSEVPIDKEEIKEKIDTVFDTLNEEAQVKHHTMVYFGDPSDRANLEAKRDDVDMIIGGSNINFEKLIRAVNKPILVIKESCKPYNSILIPTDLSEKSKEAIGFVKTHFPSDDLKLVYGYESIAMVTTMYDINYTEMVNYQQENQEIAAKLLKKFEEEVGVSGTLTDATFSLSSGILDYVEKKNPDLVVVASHSGDNDFFIGSTSGYIAKESRSDVLIYC
ncbi:universal stress protein [bacterium]|nr:universal stress protein [bacterium]MBU1958188.1 universal stress protein [bacterium]